MRKKITITIMLFFTGLCGGLYSGDIFTDLYCLAKNGKTRAEQYESQKDWSKAIFEILEKPKYKFKDKKWVNINYWERISFDYNSVTNKTYDKYNNDEYFLMIYRDYYTLNLDEPYNTEINEIKKDNFRAHVETNIYNKEKDYVIYDIFCDDDGMETHSLIKKQILQPGCVLEIIYKKMGEKMNNDELERNKEKLLNVHF